MKIGYNGTGDKMINYPTKKTKSKTSFVSSAHRGLSLEEDINKTNAYYLVHKRANVHKKPTPVQVVHVQYPARNKAKITEAYYKRPSTTDYNGVYKGFALDFEVKETNHERYLTLGNLHQHQLDHLQSVHEHGAIAFLLVRFSKFNETYLLTYEKLAYFLETMTRKSIPRAYFIEHGHLIPYTHIPPIDYLKVIDALLLKE